MSKSLKSYPSHQVEFVVDRRIAAVNKPDSIKGLGYWAAIDYRKKNEKPKKGKKNGKEN